MKNKKIGLARSSKLEAGRMAMVFILLSAFCLQLSALLIGCAEIKPPSPEEIMREPFGKGPLHVGMSKEKIKSIWGEPDMVNVLEADSQGLVKEEWIYRGRYPNLPINVGYLSETQHLFFDGEHLVRFYHQK